MLHADQFREAKLSVNFYHKRQGYIDTQRYSETSQSVSMVRYQMTLTR